MKVLENIYYVIISNPILSSIVSFIIIEIATRIAKKFSILKWLLVKFLIIIYGIGNWFRIVFTINKLNTKVNILEKELKDKTPKEIRSSEKVEVKSHYKVIWDNLDEAEKEVLRQFKTKNTVEISRSTLRKATYIGLINKSIIIRLPTVWDAKVIPCSVDIPCIEYLKLL